MNWWYSLEMMFWIGCLLLNFWLIYKKKLTISQRYHALLEQKYDYVVMIGVLILQILTLIILPKIFEISGPGEAAIFAIRNIIIGHWCWHED